LDPADSLCTTDWGALADDFSGCWAGIDAVKLELSPMIMFELLTLPPMVILLSPVVFLFGTLVLRGILVDYSQLEISTYYTAVAK
jgi:hypothetical protein